MPDAQGRFKGIAVPELPWLVGEKERRFGEKLLNGDLSRRVPEDFDALNHGGLQARLAPSDAKRSPNRKP
jgi:hypothetical protein